MKAEAPISASHSPSSAYQSHSFHHHQPWPWCIVFGLSPTSSVMALHPSHHHIIYKRGLCPHVNRLLKPQLPLCWESVPYCWEQIFGVVLSLKHVYSISCDVTDLMLQFPPQVSVNWPDRSAIITTYILKPMRDTFLHLKLRQHKNRYKYQLSFYSVLLVLC